MQEALLMGLQTSGSDLSKEMVADSRTNLDWLGRESGQILDYSLFQADATRLTKNQLPATDFSIVTETWLGPLMTQCPSPLELPKIQREIEAVYEGFFDNLRRIVKEPTTVVFTAPYHKEKNLRHFLPRLPEILRLNTKIVPLSDHERPSMFYERKNQIVGREIWKVIIG
jgi:tRNA G10  N-methylase Trm11